MQAVFHLAYHVRDLAQARQFYGTLLGCEEGRSSDSWVDFNFFGHQLSLHLGVPFAVSNTGKVSGQRVPMPHLGVILPMAEWQKLATQLSHMKVQFVMPPAIRFAGEAGEQASMFLLDPSGNPIEIKAFANPDGVYAK